MPLSFPSMYWGGSELVPPVSDYVLWLDFGDISTIFMANGKNPDGTTPAGAYVGQIKDKSPKLRHAFNYPSGGTAGFQYVQPALGYNGRSVLYASGTGILTSTWEHYDNLTIFMIYKHMTSPDRSRIFSQVAYSAGDVTYDPMIYSSTVALLSASTTGGLTAGVTMSAGWWWRLMHTKLLDNATNKVGAAVSPVGAIAVGDLKKTAKVDYAIGGRIGTDAITLSMMGKGQYAEVIAYPRGLTLPEIKAMDDYFAAKYGDTTISVGAAAERPMTPAEIAALDPGEFTAKRTLTPTDHFASIKVATISNVDWGDGSPVEQAAANVHLDHVYAATSGDVTVRVTAVAQAAMNPDLSIKYALSRSADAGWSEITIRDPHMTDFTVKPNSLLKKIRILGQNKWAPAYRPTNLSRMPDVEEIELDYYDSASNPNGWFIGNTKLKRFICLTAGIRDAASASFFQCKSLELVQWDISRCTFANEMYQEAHLSFNPVYDLPNATSIASMFMGATGVTSVTLTNTRKVTTALNAFRSPSLVTVNRMDFDSLTEAGAMCMAPSMVHHPGWNGELVQNVSNLFTNNALMETVGDIGMANVTNTNQMFMGCSKLRSFTLRGLKVTVAINGMQLSAAALDAVFTSLGTANAGATINITGNPGAATCTKSIATAKGWGVTG